MADGETILLRALTRDTGPVRAEATVLHAGSRTALAEARLVDARGKLHGLEGGYVADAAIMPYVPRANTNIPAAVIAEKIAGLLLEAAG